ncbi:MAG: AAA family ATPase [Planctomycetota bacterium]|nr:MAG: AAA family ATPase [Planctomycetota bacterium]
MAMTSTERLPDHLAGLNPAQREAVTSLNGPVLVLAGAGSGKTRVITHRMVELIRCGTDPGRILSVTFTNKAAREMLERTLGLLGGRPRRRPWIGTFHAYCVRVLREDAPRLGYPKGFVIHDRGDQESAARQVLRDIKAPTGSVRPADLVRLISRWKSAGLDPASVYDVIENDLEYIAAVAYRKYQQLLRATGAMDFDDLLLLTNRLFREHPDVLRRHRGRFDFVQIDEYQDTNRPQFELIQMLVAEHRNLCVVGDDDQSIYAWRGAEVTHILRFQEHFPDAKVIRLVENYRCTPQILELANRLVRHNRHRHHKQLQAVKRSGAAVRVGVFATEVDEAVEVVTDIRRRIESGAAAPQDIAILFRTNEQPRLFEDELRRQKVPYVLIGSRSFFDRKEVRDVLAYLKAIEMPEDDVSLSRILNTPPRGVGAATAERLLSEALSRDQPLWEVVHLPEVLGTLPRAAVRGLESLTNLLRTYRERFRNAPAEMAETLRQFLRDVRYEEEIRRQYPTPEQQEQRFQVLGQILDWVQQYVERSERPSLQGFLQDTALLGRENENEKDEQLGRNAVRLMTIHAAKGLEFPCVYLVGMEEGLLPHRRSIESESQQAVEEERRLAYVAITRARDHLTVTRSASRTKWGKRRMSHPSRFLYEMFDDWECRDPFVAEAAG